MSSFLSLVAFQLGGGRGPGPPGYAYGLIITVQVCSHINYKICHNQTAKQGRTQGGLGVQRLKQLLKHLEFLREVICQRYNL